MELMNFGKKGNQMLRLKLFVFIAFIFVLSGCATQRRCNIKFPPSVTRDSVRIESIKEIPVYLPGDTVNIKVPINCPDQDIANIETSKLKQEIRILNGKLISNTHIKPDTVFVTVKEIETKVNNVIVKEPVKFVPPLVKKLAWIGGIAVLLFLLWFAYKVYSIFNPKI